MIITNDRRNLVLPEPGDIFKTAIQIGETPKLVLVRAEEVTDDPDNCSGCIFESICIESNTTNFVCYGPDRYDGKSIKMVPVKLKEMSDLEA